MKAVEIIRPYVRNGAFPIDALSVFTSYSDALNYAYNNPSAYATQIVGVDDKEHKKTAIYRINYDPNRVHRYILERIEIGNGTTAFNFKGSVPTYSELPSVDVKQGEMWLVEDENQFYISFIDPDKNIQWKQLEVNIQIVSRTNDGLLSKDVYKTFFNDNKSDAVYFSKKSEEVSAIPEDNRWINVEHTKKENTRNYSIASVGMVKEIISGIMEQTTPYLEIESDIKSDNIIHTTIMPTLSINYHQEFGGIPVRARIVRYINKLDRHEVFNGVPNFVQIMNTNSHLYTWVWQESENVTANANDSIDYEVEVFYDDSVDSNLSAGSCVGIKSFFFYKTIAYGHNLKTYPTVFLKNKNTIDLQYDPNDSLFVNQSINKIFITIPTEAILDSIEYVPQHDKYAKSLFKLISNDGYIKTYEYSLFGNMKFTSPGEFIFNIHLPLNE